MGNRLGVKYKGHTRDYHFQKMAMRAAGVAQWSVYLAYTNPAFNPWHHKKKEKSDHKRPRQ